MKTRTATDQAFGLALLSPAAAFILCFAVFPIARVLWLSLFAQNLATGLQPQFAGTANYIRLANDGRFLQTLGTTCLFTTVTVAIELGLGLGFALLLNRDFAGRSFARAAVLVPWALPTAVLALQGFWF